MEAIFWPKGKRLIVSGIVIESEDAEEVVATTQGEMQEALSSYWGQVYEAKECDSEKAKQLLNVYRRQQGHLFQFSELELPDIDCIEGRIRRAVNSACGPNGIPYAAYQAIPATAARVLHSTMEDLSDPHPATDLADFNKQLVWFAPKGHFTEDRIKVVRKPSTLRTIFGSNCDSKIIAGSIASVLTEPMLAVTPEAQRGFCRNRQLGLNIVDLDVFLRLFNNLADPAEILRDISSIPACVLYDFCNAFPTLIHKWLFLVLVCLQVPAKIRAVVLSLYKLISAYSSGIGDESFLFHVLGGVRAGCPLSSVLFILCVNPFLYLFIMLSDNPGFSKTRVCADDFGSSIYALRTLRTHYSIFNVAALVAGLHLKPSKCVIVISCVHLSSEVKQGIIDWLLIHVPGFAQFKIQESGKYLGWFLGLQSIELSFQEPRVKFVNRIEEICSGKAPAATCICRYNQRAASVFSYVAQFAPPLTASSSPTSRIGPFIGFCECLLTLCLESCLIASGFSPLLTRSPCPHIVKLFNSDLHIQKKITSMSFSLMSRAGLETVFFLTARPLLGVSMEFLMEDLPSPLF